MADKPKKKEQADKPKKKEKVSSAFVGVCVYVDNRPDLALLTIAHLKKNTRRRDVTFHVVCDGCDDYTVQAVKDATGSAGKRWSFSSVDVKSRLAASASVANGMVADGATEVCLLDGDVLVPPGWLTSMKGCMKETGAALVFPLSNEMTSGAIAMSGSRRAAKKLKPMSWLQASTALSARRSGGTEYPEVHRPDPACCLMSSSAVKSFVIPEGMTATGCALSSLLVETDSTAFVDDGIYCYHFNSSLADSSDLLSRESQILYVANPSLQIVHRKGASAWGSLVSSYSALNPPQPAQEKSVVFSSSSIDYCGGSSGVADLSNRLCDLGLDVELNYISDTYNHHSLRSRAIKFKNIRTISARTDKACASSGVIVSTNWTSSHFVNKAVEKSSSLLAVSYWQDREDLCGRFGGGFFATPDDRDEYLNIMQKVATSEYTIKSAERDLGATAFRKINDGVDVNLFYPPASRGGKVRVLALSRNSVAHKGSDTIVEVYSQLKETHGDKISLEIFGESMRSPDVDVAHKRLSRPRLAQLMREVHIVVCASASEGSCITGLEAMASGASFVTLNNGGISEYAVNEGNCLIVNASEMSAAIAMLADNPSLRESLGAAGRETALEFSLARCAGSWFEYLSGIFNPPPKVVEPPPEEPDPLQE